MVYVIDVDNGTDKGSIVPDIGFQYTKNLNQINEAEIKISGTGLNKRGLLVSGATVYIYKDGTLEFKGIIDNKDVFVGGTVSFHSSGYEVKLAKEDRTYSSSPWTSTASATIFSSIIGESSYFSAGTINTGYTLDYRLSLSTSLWNAISNLANKTGQDISINYTSSEISVLTHLGSSTSVAVLNEGKEITNIQSSEGFPRGNIIKVYGKGDGDNQITGTATDATSVAAYGPIVKTITDYSVMSDDEADRLAAAELALNKDIPIIFDFELTNPDYTGVVLGDIITINALDVDAVNKEVRVVGILEGVRNENVFKSFQVTNPELKTLMLTKNKYLAKIQKQQTDQSSYMQGNAVTNEYGTGINADSTHGAKVGFYVPPEFVTETGSLQVLWMKADYDIDPYNSQFGDASFTGSDPQVKNTSGDEEANVSGLSGEDDPDVTGYSDSGGTEHEADTGTTSTTAITITSSYTKIADINPDSSDSGGMFINIAMGRSSESDYTRLEFYVYSSSGITYCDGWDSYVSTDDISGHTAANIGMFIPENTGNYTYDVYVRYAASDGATTESSWLARTGWITLDTHEHDDGSYKAIDHDHDYGSFKAIDHSHPNGSYDIDSADLDYISIGDSVSDAASVNSTGATVYLDYWNGSSWVNKHSVAYLSDTLKSNIDMTNSGAYPDTDGYWRIRVTPNSATADFVNAKVRIKIKIDN